MRVLLLVTYSMGMASLLLFAGFLWRGSFHFLPLGLSTGGALAFDAGLSLLFFVQHSTMVRECFGRRLSRIVPAPYHGVVYALASSITLLACVLLWQRSAMAFEIEGVPRLVMRGVFVIAIVGFVWSSRALGAFDAFGIRQARAHRRGSTPAPPVFAARGPYRWVRHPFYFFTLVLIWSCPVLSFDRLLFNGLWTAWMVLGTVLEERDLVALFGEEYRQYQRRVPMLVPYRGGLRS